MTQFPQHAMIVDEPRSGGGLMAGFGLTLGIGSLLCCWVPVLGVVIGPLAILLGILVLRKGEGASGRGVAIAGIATGLLGVIASVVVLAGVGMAMMQVRNFSNSVGTAITAAQSGNPAELSALVAPESGPLTDEQIAAFATRVKDKMGSFQKPYGGLMEVIPTTMKFITLDQARAQRIQQKYQPMVYPAQFDNGRGAVVLLLPHGSSAAGPTGMPLLANLGVYQEGSTEIIWLAEPEP
jgi:hypothetical protein